MTACWWQMRTGPVTTEFNQPADAALNLSHALHTTHGVSVRTLHTTHGVSVRTLRTTHGVSVRTLRTTHGVSVRTLHTTHGLSVLSARLSSCTAVPSWAAFGSAPNVSFSFSAWRCSFCQFWYSLIYLFHFGKRQNSVIKVKLCQKEGVKPIVQ